MKVAGASFRYSLLYGSVFFNPGVFAPFFPLFLAYQGFDAAAVGAILALSGPARLIGNSLLLWLLDLGAPARTLLVSQHVAAAGLMALAISIQSFWPMAIIVAIGQFVHTPSSAIVDAIVTRASRRNPALIYGRVRLWGSITFIIANLLGGLAVSRGSPVAAVWLLVAGLLASALLFLTTPREEAAAPHATAPTGLPARAPVAVLCCVILAAARVQSSHAAVQGFGAIYWQSIGYPGSLIAIMWAVGALAEIILFVRFASLASDMRGALIRLGASAAAGVIRWGLMMFEQPVWMTLALQALHAMTFAMTHLAAMSALSLLVPANWRGRAQGFYAATVALLTSLASYASGVIYESYGLAAFGLMAVLAGCAAALSFVAWLLLPKTTR